MNIGIAKRTTGRMITIAVAGALLAPGCAYLKQSKDHFDMYRAPAAAQLQVLNPEAGENRKVVAGLDAAAADQVKAAYVRSFERQAETKAEETFAGLSGVASN